MSTGVGSTVENLITKVVLMGVNDVTRDQAKVGMGFKALSGDLRGCAADFKALGAAAQLGIGVGLVGVAAGMFKYLAGGAKKTAEYRDAVESLATAFSKMGKGGTLEAEGVAKSFNKLPAVISNFRSEMMQGSQSLAWAGAGQKDIEGLMPLILDTSVAMGKLGKEISPAQIGFGLMKAIAAGTGGQLRKMGIDINNNALKTKNWSEIIKGLSKFQGAAAKEAGDWGGATFALSNAWGALQKSLGADFADPLIKLMQSATAFIKWITAINENTHGLIGILAGLASAFVGVTGVVILGRLAVNALAFSWNGVTVSALRAAKAQREAVSGGKGPAVASGVNNFLSTAGATAAGAGIAGATTASIAARRAAVNASLKGMGMRLPGEAASVSITEHIKNRQAAKAAATVTEEVATKGFMNGAKSFLSKGVGGLFAASMIESIGTMGKNATQARYQNDPSATNNLLDTLTGVGTDVAAGAVGGLMVGGPMGALVGGIGGAIYSVFDQINRQKENEAAWDSNGVTPKADSSSNATSNIEAYLKKIMENTGKQVIGGGERAKDAYNSGDVERALYKTLTGAVT